jgi:hypothetical protein
MGTDSPTRVSIFGDIKSVWLLHAKGFLFLVAGIIAFVGILREMPHWRVAALLAVGTWAFCRFYYYLFYVLENYAGRNQRYAGILDALKYLLIRKKKK